MKRKKLKRKFQYASVLLFLLFSNGYLANKVLKACEYGAESTFLHSKTYDYAIVLGGMTKRGYEKRIEFTEGADRAMQGILKYRDGTVKKLIVSGASGSLTDRKFKEAKVLKDFMIKMGVNENDILIEPNSRNTHENAAFVKKKFFEEGKSYLLITSAFHMRRSLACFRKEGMQVDPFPVDYLSVKKVEVKDYFIPDIGVFKIWDLVIKEVVGYVIYDIVGYI